MAAAIKPGWSKPSTILFASEIPANEKAFGFALSAGRRVWRGSHYFSCI